MLFLTLSRALMFQCILLCYKAVALAYVMWFNQCALKLSKNYCNFFDGPVAKRSKDKKIGAENCHSKEINFSEKVSS